MCMEVLKRMNPLKYAALGKAKASNYTLAAVTKSELLMALAFFILGGLFIQVDLGDMVAWVIG